MTMTEKNGLPKPTKEASHKEAPGGSERFPADGGLMEKAAAAAAAKLKGAQK